MTKRKLTLMAVDCLIILFSCIMTAIVLPYMSSFEVIWDWIEIKIAVLTVCIMVSRVIFHLYNRVWRYAQPQSYVAVMLADAVAALVFLLIGLLESRLYPGMAYMIVAVVLTDLLTLCSRFVYQIIYSQQNLWEQRRLADKSHQINVAIIGAGSVGAGLANEFLCNPNSHYNPYCFVDIDKNKIGNRIHGLMVYGDDDRIIERLKELPVQELVIALPKSSPEQRAVLYEKYSATGCSIKIYSGPLDGEAGKNTLREVKIEDLLFRETMDFGNRLVASYYSGKTVLITGGGGSIGSELCRQVASCGPKKLIVFDEYENNAYDIQQELLGKYAGRLNIETVIGSVRDTERLEQVFSAYRPEVVFHAAAHKHVPLMEDSPAEAVKNNVLGTMHTADMAEKYGAGKFILISTDKAVNPTNIMGASKRLCEMVVQCRKDSATEFAAVRFGNVLGSNGSVIPLFRRQIASGGPVTITDKRIIRYFMTIPEAAQLVMEAGTMAKRGELFVLDMGKPVRILNLAEKMITLSGYMPYKDIDIVEIGLRPGEKLYEELLMDSETLDKTENGTIFIERDAPLTRQQVQEKLDILKAALAEGTPEAIRKAVRDTVPTFRNPEELNREAEQSKEFAECVQ